jgi:predicted dienelactone hydrolase
VTTRRALLLFPIGLTVIETRAAAMVSDERWIDARRQRTLPLRIRWPAGDGPCAVVLFSHGLGGSRFGADGWGRAWADAGFVVVHLQHRGSDAALVLQGMQALRDGGLAALRAGASPEQLLARIDDVRFVLDEIERRRADAASPWARTAGQKVGMSGHSFGARTTQAIAGQRFPLPGDFADPRPAAFIAFSPSLGGPWLTPQEQFATVTRPLLALTGSQDGDPFGAYADGAPREAVYDALPRGRRARLWLDGADHMSFAGNVSPRIEGRGPFARRPGALQAEPAHHALIARVTTLWWRAWLRDEGDALATLRALGGLGPGDRWAIDG